MRILCSTLSKSQNNILLRKKETEGTKFMFKTLSSFIVLCSIASVFAQSTVFTYQGRLNDNGQPANGTYDLRFGLYDSTNLPGNIIAGPVNNPSTQVANGLFSASLDFGNVFNGTARWLEIAVRTNGAANFVTLTPRQPLTPVPYAIFASATTNLVGTLSAANIAPVTSLIASSSNGLYSSISSSWSTNVASSAKAGIITSNDFVKLYSYPNAFNVISPLPPMMVNTYWFTAAGGGGDVTTTNNMQWYATNGVLALAQKYNTPFYYVIDDFWMDRTNVPNGILQPDPHLYPNGIKAVADEAHALGMKFGLYPQSAGWVIYPTNYSGNATNFVAWGVDYLKFELGNPGGPTQDEYLLNILLGPFWASGRPVFVESGIYDWYPAFTGLVQAPRPVRTGDANTYFNLMNMVDYTRVFSPSTIGPGRGFFPCIDYVSYYLTLDQEREHWTAEAMIPTLWAFAFPTNTDASHMAGVTNEDVFAINQDPLVSPGFLVSSTNYVNVYERRCVSNTVAVSIENRNTFATNYTLWFTNLPGVSPTSVIRDCWAHTNCSATGSFTIHVNATSAALLRFAPLPVTNVVAVNWPGSMTISTALNGVQTLSYAPLDPDASSYLARSGVTNNPAEMLAAATAVSLGKQHGWWTNWDALYLFRGSSSNSTAQNLVSTNYTIIWQTNGITFAWNGVTGDGTNGYGNTQFNPSTASGRQFTTNSASFFVYNRTPAPISAGGMNAFIGINTSPKAGLFCNDASHSLGMQGLNAVADIDDVNVLIEPDSHDFGGYILANRYARNAQTIFHDQVTGNTVDSTLATGLPNGTFYLFGANGGGLNSPSGCNLALAGFGGGMTGAQWLLFQDDMRTVMSILGL